MPSQPPAPGRPSPRPPAREIALFTVLALTLAWLAHVPVLLTGEGPGSTAYWITSGFFMLTPSIAAFVVIRYVWRPGHPARATGLPLLRPRSRGLLYCLLGVVLVPLLGTASALAADGPVDTLLYPGGTGGVIGLGVMAVLALLVLVCGGLRTRSFDSPQARAGHEREAGCGGEEQERAGDGRVTRTG